MKKWMIKAAIQQAIGCLPQSYRWNRLFQKYVTRGLFLKPSAFEDKVIAARTFLDHYTSVSRSPVSHPKILELGTGWFPVVPLSFFLCGSEEIWTFDINPLLEEITLAQTVQYFLDAEREGRLALLLPNLSPERMGRLRDWAGRRGSLSPKEALKQLNIHLVIGDARKTGLPDGSIDFFMSNFALEHIPAEIQLGLWKEFHRLSTPNSVMSHRFGIADQYFHVDESLTPFNYLQYSSRQWRFLNNPLSPQTRLRVSDYRKVLREAGFEIVKEKNIPGSKEQLQSIRLADEFKHYTEEDLLIIWSTLVSRPV